MIGDPDQHRAEVVKHFGFRRGWPAHDDDLNLKRAGCLDLGVSRVTAAVLGDQRVHPLVAHKRKFISERERAARENQLVFREGVYRCGAVDGPRDVAMLRRLREDGELQTALSQKYRLRPNPKSGDGVLHGRDLDPAVARLARPRRPAEDDERGTGRAAGRDRVGRDARSERMGRVDNGVDVLTGEKCRQVFGAAKAADAPRDWRRSRFGRRSCERQDCGNIGLIRDPPRERAGLRRSAENEQTKRLQWAAP